MRKFLRKMAKVAKVARKSLEPEQFTLARKLAVLERKGYVQANDPLVEVFAAALQRLAGAAHVTEQRAADVSVQTHQLAGKRTLLEVMTDLHDSIPAAGLGGVSLAELAGAYIILILSPS